MEDKMERTELKELAVFDGMMEANIVKSKLESFEIPCLLKYEATAHVFGFTLNGLGKVQLMVSPDDFQRALGIIEAEEIEAEPEQEAV